MSHTSRFVRHMFVFTSLLAAHLASRGQDVAPLICSTPDGDVAIPTKTGWLGKKDPAALAELTAHLAAVGGNPWIGMQGTGTIVYEGNTSLPYEATLSNLGWDQYRLDARTKSGQTTTRIHRLIGRTKASDGTMSEIPPETAFSGLFPFEIARINMSSIDAAEISLLDHGITAIGSESLHRVTVESPSVGIRGTSSTHVIDLYFDPNTHLLVKSVVFDPLGAGRKVNFVFVVNYSDYRLVGTSLVPFHLAETMEGVPYYDLQLLTVETNPNLTSHDFEF